MPDDIRPAQQTIVAVVICHCPYCRHPIRAHNRLSYPAAVVGAFATVYRCPHCHRHIGAPVGDARDEE